jgi:anti-anti-sigma factor
MSDFSYSLDHDTGHAIAYLTGEIDLAAVGALEAAIETARSASNGKVVLDMGAVTFLDSSGLRVLMAAHNKQAAMDGQLVITNPSDAVVRVLDITGLLGTMTATGD